MGKKDNTEEKIKNGEYILTDLNIAMLYMYIFLFMNKILD